MRRVRLPVHRSMNQAALLNLAEKAPMATESSNHAGDGAAPPIRVLLVDDHEVVRRGLQAILERNPEIAVVGEGNSVASGVREAARVHPDVVVMDLRLPDGSGIEACRQIRDERPEIQVLILTSHADEDALFSA